eukprot:1160212-Pelagomonas_calceolata.AAC.3
MVRELVDIQPLESQRKEVGQGQARTGQEVGQGQARTGKDRSGKGKVRQGQGRRLGKPQDADGVCFKFEKQQHEG